MPIIVLHVVLSLNIGGLERVVINLLKTMDRKTFSPIICCLEKKGTFADEVERLGIELIELNKRRWAFDWLSLFRLAKIIQRKNITVVHAHNAVSHVYASIAAKIAKVPVVLHTKHGAGYSFNNRIFWSKLANHYTDYHIAVSEYIKNVMIKIGKINPKKIITITNGIDIEVFSAQQIDILEKKSEIGVMPDDFIIGNIARLDKAKDHYTLLKAFSIIIKQHPAKLVLVGDGPLKMELIETCKKLKVYENVRFLGARKDIAEILKTFDLFVLSSTTEGISMTILEAMASGLPVVATNVGGNPEIIIHEETGLLVQPGDYVALAYEVLKLINDPRLAKKMGTAGRERVISCFSVEKMSRNYEKIYKHLLFKNEIIQRKYNS